MIKEKEPAKEQDICIDGKDITKSKKSKLKIIIICLLVFIFITLIAAQIITHISLKENFSRGEYSQFTTNYRYDHYEQDYPRKNVSFKSGDNLLQGYIYGCDNNKGLIVFSHGIGGGHEGYIGEIIWLVNNGWRVFAYDATGSCTSEGEGTNGLPQSALDLDCALNYIENDKELSELPKFLMGHSWGGYAVTAVLNFDHDVKASASISGYAYPMDMIMEFADGMMGSSSKAMYPFIWLDCYMNFGKYTNMSAIDGINKSDIPVLVIHGTEDTMIGYNRSSIISKKSEITNPNVRYYPIDGKYCGHSNILHSDETNEYLDKLDSEYEKICDKYKDGKVPDDAESEFYEKADKELANQVNEELMTEINKFFEAQL